MRSLLSRSNATPLCGCMGLFILSREMGISDGPVLFLSSPLVYGSTAHRFYCLFNPPPLPGRFMTTLWPRGCLSRRSTCPSLPSRWTYQWLWPRDWSVCLRILCPPSATIGVTSRPTMECPCRGSLRMTSESATLSHFFGSRGSCQSESCLTQPE